MIIEVKQTQGNLKNKFEIKVNGETRYLAGTPWMKIEMPLHADRIRRCVLTEPDGTVRFRTDYRIGENAAHTAIPMKWLLTGSQRSLIYHVRDAQDAVCGTFYRLTKGFMDSRYVIEYGQYRLMCYDVSSGTARHLCIYSGERQIAEILKPLSVEDNLDTYFLFLMDEREELGGILSFFAVLFDYLHYPGSGQVVAQKKEVSISYSYGKNNKFYDRNWITDHFGEESAGMLSKLEEDRKKMAADIRNQAKKILLLIALFWAAALIAVLIILYCIIGV